MNHWPHPMRSTRALPPPAVRGCPDELEPDDTCPPHGLERPTADQLAHADALLTRALGDRTR